MNVYIFTSLVLCAEEFKAFLLLIFPFFFKFTYKFPSSLKGKTNKKVSSSQKNSSFSFSRNFLFILTLACFIAFKPKNSVFSLKL